ncbi:DNA polymerase III subunit delta [compost metagenome]
MATMMRGWLQAKLLAERGMNADAIAQALGAKSSFKIKKDLEQCRAWSSGQLRGALALLLETDVTLKTGTGRGMEALQLEKLLVQLSRL